MGIILIIIIAFMIVVWGYYVRYNRESQKPLTNVTDAIATDQLSDYFILYKGIEIDKKVGVQFLDYMEITAANAEKYHTTYYNYENGIYVGKTAGIFGKEQAYENTSWVENVDSIAISKKYDAMPRPYKMLKDLPEELMELADATNVDIMAIDLERRCSDRIFSVLQY